jgi:hypothetical protein
MTTIQLSTTIKAPIEIILIYQNIDVHQQSTSKSNETAIDGITSGLIINENRYLAWQTFWCLKHKALSAMDQPAVDEMLERKFKSSNTSILYSKNICYHGR